MNKQIKILKNGRQRVGDRKELFSADIFLLLSSWKTKL